MGDFKKSHNPLGPFYNRGGDLKALAKALRGSRGSQDRFAMAASIASQVFFSKVRAGAKLLVRSQIGRTHGAAPTGNGAKSPLKAGATACCPYLGQRFFGRRKTVAD